MGSSIQALIETHFVDTPDHDILDLELMLIDCVPASTKFTVACVDLEEIWIGRLLATLNVKKQIRNSFSGYAKARNTPAIDDEPDSQL